MVSRVVIVHDPPKPKVKERNYETSNQRLTCSNIGSHGKSTTLHCSEADFLSDHFALIKSHQELFLPCKMIPVSNAWWRSWYEKKMGSDHKTNIIHPKYATLMWKKHHHDISQVMFWCFFFGGGHLEPCNSGRKYQHHLPHNYKHIQTSSLFHSIMHMQIDIQDM